MVDCEKSCACVALRCVPWSITIIHIIHIIFGILRLNEIYGLRGSRRDKELEGEAKKKKMSVRYLSLWSSGGGGPIGGGNVFVMGPFTCLNMAFFFDIIVGGMGIIGGGGFKYGMLSKLDSDDESPIMARLSIE